MAIQWFTSYEWNYWILVRLCHLWWYGACFHVVFMHVIFLLSFILKRRFPGGLGFPALQTRTQTDLLCYLRFITAGIQTAHTASAFPPSPNRSACVRQSDTLQLLASTQPRFSQWVHTGTWGEQNEGRKYFGSQYKTAVKGLDSQVCLKERTHDCCLSPMWRSLDVPMMR